MDRFLNYRNDTLIVEDNKINQRILFYPDGDNKSVGLLYKGLSVVNLTIFNLTPKNFNSFKIINPITHNYVTIKRHLSEDQREIFLYKIKTESCIKFVAYSVKWDLSHWSGFSSIQEEEAKEFENLRDVKNWLENISGIKCSQMAYSEVQISKYGLDLHLPSKIGLEFDLNEFK